ncbi:predicted protein [Histoplasma capsulatum G186AR]|uniref:Uncharacterized protein n=1 Tax=Ajellomyces capsulatus (strain G186AR / H82 / ATCC MYA-2454 / RMSCC 2432) TaxID=447093 RepID=C0P1B7_AJECG|nr:uncharacterized protein HCBG_09197 [Histoplasma capsulatum G186AR]EEH02560.1 predicted protein [Histoplasma capsulatum G186AR]
MKAAVVIIPPPPGFQARQNPTASSILQTPFLGTPFVNWVHTILLHHHRRAHIGYRYRLGVTSPSQPSHQLTNSQPAKQPLATPIRTRPVDAAIQVTQVAQVAQAQVKSPVTSHQSPGLTNQPPPRSAVASAIGRLAHPRTPSQRPIRSPGWLVCLLLLVTRPVTGHWSGLKHLTQPIRWSPSHVLRSASLFLLPWGAAETQQRHSSVN